VLFKNCHWEAVQSAGVGSYRILLLEVVWVIAQVMTTTTTIMVRKDFIDW
jgi:hypothetical protein